VAQNFFLISASFKPPQPGRPVAWGRLIGASAPLAAAELAASVGVPVVVLADDPRSADQIEAGIRFFGGDDLDTRTSSPSGCRCSPLLAIWMQA
jgi:hypothetical protein